MVDVATGPNQNDSPVVRPGDNDQALRRFFKFSLDAVYPYLFQRCGHDRATAEDLTQETFVTAVRALREGRVDRLEVGWMVRTARSRFIDHCRSEARRERHLHPVPSAEAVDVADGVVSEAAVVELLSELPPSQRLVTVLHHLDGMRVSEVASATGNSVRAVESSLARARRRLRQLQEGDGR